MKFTDILPIVEELQQRLNVAKVLRVTAVTEIHDFMVIDDVTFKVMIKKMKEGTGIIKKIGPWEFLNEAYLVLVQPQGWNIYPTVMQSTARNEQEIPTVIAEVAWRILNAINQAKLKERS